MLIHRRSWLCSDLHAVYLYLLCSGKNVTEKLKKFLLLHPVRWKRKASMKAALVPLKRIRRDEDLCRTAPRSINTAALARCAEAGAFLKLIQTVSIPARVPYTGKEAAVLVTANAGVHDP